MKVLSRLLGVFLFLALFAAPFPSHAGTVIVPGAAGGAFSVNVTSIKEARFRSTIRQQYDYSCGSAALATLLSYHYEKKLGEQEIFNAMFEVGNKEKIRAQGFSLLDMKKYLEANGYRAGGYQAPLDTLLKVRMPAIVLLSVSGYRHFVVIKGISETEVLVGDPALGVRVIPRKEFQTMWNGLLFLILDKEHVARKHFNLPQEWRARTKAPLETWRDTRITDITLFMR